MGATPAPASPAPRRVTPRSTRHGRRRGPALTTEQLSKRFGDRIAFENVSLEVAAGEIFGFLGPNGAGKTTMVRTLGTLLAPSSGRATVAGLELTATNGVPIRTAIAVLTETPGLYLRLSVVDNLACFADLYGLDDPRQRVTRALGAVGMTDRAGDLCGALSKGLRQRVALARALLAEPEILFLDEPTSGLDPASTHEVLGLIDGLRHRGVTVFLTTHRLDEAERLCDRVAILNTTLRVVGTPGELRDQLFAPAVSVRTLEPLANPEAVFTGLPGVQSWRCQQPGAYVLIVDNADVAAPAATRALVQAGADVVFVGRSRRSLEDTYLQLVGHDQGTTP